MSFDAGYHVEHHDFPWIPWCRLRAVHKLAEEEYRSLAHIRSWTLELLLFLLRSDHRVDDYVNLKERSRRVSAGT